MNLKRFQFTVRELGLMLIAVGALAFAWLGTANADSLNESENNAPCVSEVEQGVFFKSGVLSEEDAAFFAEMDEDGHLELGDFEEDVEWLEAEDMMFESIVKTLGIDIDTLFAELDSGKSIADVATANNVDPQTIIDQLIAEENAFIDELVASGEIDAAEAEEWKAESVQFTPFMVNSVHIDPDAIAAQVIGVDVETLRTEIYENGSTIKALAEANNVDPQAVIDAIVAAEDASIDEMVAAGVVTEEESAEWKAENTEFATSIVNGEFDMFDFEMGMFDFECEGDDESTDGEDSDA